MRRGNGAQGEVKLLPRRGAGARQQRVASNKTKSGSGAGEAVGTIGYQGATARKPPHSLTRVSAAAGRAADHGAASPSRVVRGAGQRSLALLFLGAAWPGPMCPPLL